MNGRMKWTKWAIFAVWAALSVAQANAAPVAYQKVGFIKDTDYYSEAFTIDSAGSYRATLTDFNFPSAFGQLALDLTTATDTKATLTAPGSFDFNVADPGTYYASVYGVAGGALHIGLFGVQVESLSPIDAAPVPLPASMVLLLSGLFVLGRMLWHTRGPRDVAVTKESYSLAIV